MTLLFLTAALFAGPAALLAFLAGMSAAVAPPMAVPSLAPIMTVAIDACPAVAATATLPGASLCPGPAGWGFAVEHPRPGIQRLAIVSPDGRRVPVQLGALTGGELPGATRSSEWISPTVEWRGQSGAAPDALLLTFNATTLPGRSSAWLVVVRTAPAAGEPCVVAILGPEGQAPARNIADRAATAPCLPPP